MLAIHAVRSSRVKHLPNKGFRDETRAPNQSSIVSPSPDSNDSGVPFPLTQRERQLEQLTLFHAGALLIGATWAYGGNVDWAQPLLSIWATLAMPLLWFNVGASMHQRHCAPRVLHCLWPLLGLNLLVGVSLLFPGFRAGVYEGDVLYINNLVSPWLPSSARPAITLQALWLFTGVYLSAFNLLLAPRRRHAVRVFLFVLLSNALLLAIFGTFQKLSHATGLYFGHQPSPQPRFFASFIYHNHWGAFCVLMLSIGLGLFFHYLRRHDVRDLARTPAGFAVAAILAIATTVPMSGSRSCTVLALLLLGIAAVHWTLMLRKRQSGHSHRAVPAVAAIVVLAALIGFAYPLAKPAIQERLRDTQQQLKGEEHPTNSGQRTVLYQDTWRMAKDRLLFGWGMASYPYVFTLYNTQDRGIADHLPHYYHDAHSDWLQSLAELGIIGSLLLVLCLLLPLWRYRHTATRSLLSSYLLGGCAVILLYAWVEFPFGNTAVSIAYWLMFFTALRYSRVESAH